jgi:hypothetical protein
MVRFLDGASVDYFVGRYSSAAVLLVVMMESAGIPLPAKRFSLQPASVPAPPIRFVIALAAGNDTLDDNIPFSTMLVDQGQKIAGAIQTENSLGALGQLGGMRSWQIPPSRGASCRSNTSR